MNAEGFKRKLTAILSADVAGYSRLMATDEAHTVHTLETYKQIMADLISRHRGRVIDSPGDNLLAEFASVVDAVQCAVLIQRALDQKNAQLPDSRKMQFRVGINLGDVIAEGERIYGDGVNIAARLESLAPVGGICISGTALDQVRNKLEVGYAFCGVQSVKNIAQPVRVYHVVMDPAAAGKVVGEQRYIGRISWKSAVVVIITLMVIAAGLLSWNIYTHQMRKVEVASIDKMAFPLPDKPSIAVLPFINVSNDPQQEFFSDGLTEEIINTLSKVPDLMVIARNSAYTFKGQQIKQKQVSEAFGVRYILEGSVRKSENRVRIAAQLTDAISGFILWSESFDEELNDIFALQDKITIKILTSLEIKLTEGEEARLRFKNPPNLRSYLKLLEGREIFYRVTKEDNATAQAIFKEIAAADPGYAAAYGYLAATYMMAPRLDPNQSIKECTAKAIELEKKSIELDQEEVSSYSFLGFMFTLIGNFDEAAVLCEKAVKLAPNSSNVNYWASEVNKALGNHDEAIHFCELAIRLDPLPPPYFYRNLGMEYAAVGRYEEAIRFGLKSIEGAPHDILSFIFLAATYSQAGKEPEAHQTMSEVLKINLHFTLQHYQKIMNFKLQKDKDRMINALRMAGLPDLAAKP